MREAFEHRHMAKDELPNLDASTTLQDTWEMWLKTLPAGMSSYSVSVMRRVYFAGALSAISLYSTVVNKIEDPVLLTRKIDLLFLEAGKVTLAPLEKSSHRDDRLDLN